MDTETESRRRLHTTPGHWSARPTRSGYEIVTEVGERIASVSRDQAWKPKGAHRGPAALVERDPAIVAADAKVLAAAVTLRDGLAMLFDLVMDEAAREPDLTLRRFAMRHAEVLSAMQQTINKLSYEED